VETDELICEDDDLGNGFLASVICALIGLPIVGSMHIAFSWLRRPMEQELAHHVLVHEKQAGTLIIRSASRLAVGDWAIGDLQEATSDPYCVVFWNDRQIGRTKVVLSTVEPQWNAAFNLSALVGAIHPDSENVLRVEVWEWDQLTGDDFLGALHIAGQGVAFLPRIERGFSLETQKGESSSLVQGELRLEYVEKAPSSSGLVDTRKWGGPAVHTEEGEGISQRRCCKCCPCGRQKPGKVQPTGLASDTRKERGAKSGSGRYLAPDGTPLAAGWQTKTSRKTGKVYFYNRVTGASTFDPPLADGGGSGSGGGLLLSAPKSSTPAKAQPASAAAQEEGGGVVVGGNGAPLPPGWETRRSRSSGKVYFYHAATSRSEWKHPAALAAVAAAAVTGSRTKAVVASVKDAPPKRSVVEATFTEAGRFGIKFGVIQSGQPGPLKINAIEPNTQAAKHAELVPGLILVSVHGRSVVGLGKDAAVKALADAERPLAMAFVEGGQQWGAVKLAPIITKGEAGAKLPELVLQTRMIPTLPAMTGLTATLEASKRRQEENAAKVAADRAALEKATATAAGAASSSAQVNNADSDFPTLPKGMIGGGGGGGGSSNAPRQGGGRSSGGLATLLQRGGREQREVVPRQLRQAAIAYCYGLVIGIACSFFIAATAVNFGPEKTLEWLEVTGLSLVWRMFVIEPIKVLFCGGFEGVAGLITGEADDWTEGFADALGDDIEGRMEDAGVAGAGLAAMDKLSRAREKREAAVKLAAVSAFQAGAREHHADAPSPKTPAAAAAAAAGERGAGKLLP
jgi:hypothetical protein